MSDQRIHVYQLDMPRHPAEFKRTGTVHLVYMVRLQRATCKHEDGGPGWVFCLECGPFRNPEEMRYGEDLGDDLAQVVTCQRCRERARLILEALEAQALVYDEEAARVRNLLGASV